MFAHSNLFITAMTPQLQQQTLTAEEGAKHHVVIVGAGMAGLMAAQELLNNGGVRVAMFEACSEARGRVKALADFVEGHVIDLVAEFVHGQGTILTDLVDE